MKFILSFLCMSLPIPLSFVLLSSCQQKSTVVTAQLPVLTESASVNVQKWLQGLLKEEPVILDVRSPFDFNLAHTPGAVNVRWEDFSQQDPLARGLLEKDRLGLAHRLSLIGVSPDTKVLILGNGQDGNGEEGRVAWTLQVLGVKNIYTLHHKELRSLRVQDAPLIENKPMWSPHEDESLTVDINLFKNLITGQMQRSLPVSKARAGALQMPAGVVSRMSTGTLFGMPLAEVQKNLVVLDVRASEHFTIENLTQKKGVIAPVVNINWKEFYSKKGLVSEKVSEKLSAQKITKETVILVISKHGLESGAVTFALRNLGYARSANFAGGYEQWNVTK